MQKIYLALYSVIFIGMIISIITTPSWLDKEHTKAAAKGVEYTVIVHLRDFYTAQILFKSKKVSDKNNNGIGEYANLSELVKFRKDFPPETGQFFTWVYEKNSNLVEGSNYAYKIFTPSEIDLKEQYWGCLAVRIDEIGFKRNYYLDEKGVLFFTEENLSEKILDEQWLLRNIFSGEPFKSPINITRWKIFDLNKYYKDHPIRVRDTSRIR